MSRTSDSAAVRTAGIVFCLIGCVSFGVVAVWNGMVDYPEESSLERVSGVVVHGRLKEISTRTSIEKWIVIDVRVGAGTDADARAEGDAEATNGGTNGRDERWVFPSQTREWAQVVTALGVGAQVSARAWSDPERLRWSEVPVRVIWSLSRTQAGADVELVSLEEVIAVERASRYQSPVIGWTMIGLGIALILGSRLRVGAGRDVSSAG